MKRSTSFYRTLPLALGLLSQARATAVAQLRVTRADAVDAALGSGPRVALARADTAAAQARERSARARLNPALAASYSKSAPQKHLALDIPLEAPWLRGARIGAASALSRAARLQLLSERAAALVEVDTTYISALAAEARFHLSRETARDADSLRRMTVVRRDAGDASDLDVDLATVVAGQQSNVASADSLSFMSAVLTVQSLMGIPPESLTIVLADSLRPSVVDTAFALPPPLADGAAVSSTPAAIRTSGVGALPLVLTPSMAAAEANVSAAELAIARERRSVIGLPAVSIGVEFGDPDGVEPGYLPVVGLVIPLPLFSRNQGPIAEATAERDRARIQLVAARLEARRRLVEGTREREALRVRVARDVDLVASAQRVAARSLTAYREGASALPAVLEARRSAREVLGQYIDDLAALLIVNTELRALTLPAPRTP